MSNCEYIFYDIFCVLFNAIFLQHSLSFFFCACVFLYNIVESVSAMLLKQQFSLNRTLDFNEPNIF